LVDDHEVVRVGLAALIDAEDDMEVVGEAASVSEALIRIVRSRPKVALLDVRLPDGSGVELCREIRSEYPEVACIMLTSHSDDEALFSSIIAGASGYLLKGVRVDELIDAIRKVADGKSLLDSSITSKVLERLRAAEKDDEPISRLSKQEKRILELITEGKTNKEIAQSMFLAEKTVKNYVSNLLAKLGMSHRSEAAAYGARLMERKGAL
jgi:two-component system response regulator DevR